VYWIEVSGYQLPRRYGGHPALEFCNTWAGWGEPPAPNREWLKDYDRFAVWAGHVELLPPETVARLRRSPSPAVLARAREFRSALYAVLTEGDPAGFAVVAALAHRAAARARLVDGEINGEANGEVNGEPVARWELPVTPELPLLAVARSAAELLCSDDRRFVRACPGHDCGWLFLDRRGRRRWCSMDSCGNRAKVRAHAARVRES
jgi:predicted RNA-binding Zn ribbon-like protein